MKSDFHLYEQGSLKAYVIGFVSCLALTLASFFLVWKKLLTGTMLIGSISALALVQAVVQFIYFLHLNKEHSPRWNLLIFSFMLMVVVIIVAGSLWIMYNLDNRMM